MQRIANLSSKLTNSSSYGSQQSTITYAGKNNCIGVVTLFAQKTYNALTAEMRQSILENLKKLEYDPKIKVVCLRSGHPKVFCAGADIKEFEHSSNADWIIRDRFKELDLLLRYYNKPIIAAVHKLALGGGMELALHSDIILATENAQFGLPEITLGLFPGIGGTLIAKTIGK